MNDLEQAALRNVLQEIAIDEGRRPGALARIERGIARRRNVRRVGVSVLLIALVGAAVAIIAVRDPGPSQNTAAVRTNVGTGVTSRIDAKTFPDAPVPLRDASVVAGDSNYVVLWGGYTGRSDFASDGAVLDLATGTWRMLPSHPSLPGRAGAAGVILGDNLLLIGGQTREDPEGTDVVVSINLKNGMVRSVGSSSLARRSSGTAFLRGSMVVLMGGYVETNGSPNTTTGILDTSTWTWAEAGPVPWPIDNLASGRARPDVWPVADTPSGPTTVRVAMDGAHPVAEVARFDLGQAKWIKVGPTLPPDAVPFELGAMTKDADTLWFVGHIVTDTEDGTHAVQIDLSGSVVADIALHHGCEGFTHAVQTGDGIVVADGCSALRIIDGAAHPDSATDSIKVSEGLRMLAGSPDALVITNSAGAAKVWRLPNR